jgi:hypothetical protein
VKVEAQACGGKDGSRRAVSGRHPQRGAGRQTAPVILGQQGHANRAEVRHPGQIDHDRGWRDSRLHRAGQIGVQAGAGRHVDVTGQPQHDDLIRRVEFRRQHPRQADARGRAAARRRRAGQAVDVVVQPRADDGYGIWCSSDAAEQPPGQLAQLQVRVLRMPAEQRERRLGVELVDEHKSALRLLDGCAGAGGLVQDPGHLPGPGPGQRHSEVDQVATDPGDRTARVDDPLPCDHHPALVPGRVDETVQITEDLPVVQAGPDHPLGVPAVTRVGMGQHEFRARHDLAGPETVHLVDRVGPLPGVGGRMVLVRACHVGASWRGATQAASCHV